MQHGITENVKVNRMQNFSKIAEFPLKNDAQSGNKPCLCW